MSKDTIVVRGANGRKIGEIRAWTGVVDLFDKTKYGVDNLGWMTEEGPSFKDSENIVLLWAWHQVLSSADDLVNGNMPSTCLMCGEKSIDTKKPSLPWRRKDRFVGVACKNSKCKVYNVLIPWQMFYVDKEDLPWSR